MTIPLAVLLVIVGLVALLGGGELLVRGASSLALRARVTPTVVGLTIVAAGTSSPELVVSLSAAVQGSPDLAMGNVVGSNIYNIALILGLTAMIQPLKIEGNTVRMEWPVMFLCCCLLHLLGRDGELDRMEGGFFVLGMVTFTAWTIHLARSNALSAAEKQELGEGAADIAAPPATAPLSVGAAVGMVLGGIVLLSGGAQALVTGAVHIATSAGISERVVGLTVVAVGTSLPELVTSVVAAMRKQAEIAVANIIGSNIFNILGILGLTALVMPIPVSDGTLRMDNPWMLAVTLLLFPVMRHKMDLNRVDAAILLVVAVAYTAVLLLLT